MRQEVRCNSMHNSHLALEMPVMAEGEENSLWVLYPSSIELHRDEIPSHGSVITIRLVAKAITIAFADENIVSVRFDRPAWTYADARSWWSDFEAMQEHSLCVCKALRKPGEASERETLDRLISHVGEFHPELVNGRPLSANAGRS